MPEIVGSLPNGSSNNPAMKGSHSDLINNNINGLDKANGNLNGQDATEETSAQSAVRGGGSDWIDAALVAEAIGEDPASIRDVVVKAAVADGDNYCSCMWRVKAMAGDRRAQLIVKAPPRGELMQDFVSKLGFFTKEAKMLVETLPAMRAIATSRCGPDHILAQQLGPSALPCSIPGVLVMEDLSMESFKNKERQNQLDRVHCESALEILARFHALSLALHREDASSMDTYHEMIFVRREDDEAQVRFHAESQLYKFATEVETWEGTKGKGFGEKMNLLAKEIYDQMCDSVAPSEDGISVLNHGDFWINNMMFTYDEDDHKSLRPRDVRVVDLQLVRFASPALDLQYFLTTSANEEVREEMLDVMLDHYRDRFNEYVTALGMEDARWPSLDALRDEFLAKSVFGFNAVYTVLCAVVALPEDRLQLDTITKDNMHEADFSSNAWRGSNFQRIVPGVLDYFTRAGVLA